MQINQQSTAAGRGGRVRRAGRALVLLATLGVAAAPSLSAGATGEYGNQYGSVYVYPCPISWNLLEENSQQTTDINPHPVQYLQANLHVHCDTPPDGFGGVDGVDFANVSITISGGIPLHDGGCSQSQIYDLSQLYYQPFDMYLQCNTPSDTPLGSFTLSVSLDLHPGYGNLPPGCAPDANYDPSYTFCNFALATTVYPSITG